MRKPAKINGRLTITGPVVPSWTSTDYADETDAMRSEVWPAVQKFLAANYPGYGAAFTADDITLCTHCRSEFESLTAEEAVDRSTNSDERSVEGEPVCCLAAISEFRAERDEEKATATTAATATPAGPLGAGARNRLKLLRRTVVDNGGEWTTRRAQRLYANTYGPGDWRATARRDLKQLHADGLLVEHDENPDRHHYTVNTRKDGGS